MIPDPARAPARTDLPFLRHRGRPPAVAAAPVPTTAPAVPASAAAPPPPVDTRSDDEIRRAIADFVNGRSRHPGRPARGTGGGSGAVISFDRPGRSHGVPPVTPGRRPAAPSSPARPSPPPSAAPGRPAASGGPGGSGGSGGSGAPGGSGISFARPGRGTPPAPSTPARPPAPVVTGSLDLDDAGAAPTPAAAPRRAAAPQRRPPAGAQVRPGQQHLLTVRDPTVLLSRVQSGIGTLGIEAACGPDVGDLRLGAAYQLASGPTSTVQLAANGNRFAPSSRRPVIVAGRDEFEHLRVDLRQVTDLRRLAVYAFSESRSELTWGGTLVVTTFGGGRIELPLESLYPGRIAVLITLYNVDGRLVVRAEMETVAGDVREAARAYGYDRITWRDDRTPVD